MRFSSTRSSRSSWGGLALTGTSSISRARNAPAEAAGPGLGGQRLVLGLSQDNVHVVVFLRPIHNTFFLSWFYMARLYCQRLFFGDRIWQFPPPAGGIRGPGGVPGVDQMYIWAMLARSPPRAAERILL